MNKSIRNLIAEPYRLFFLGGSLYAILSMGVWFAWFFLATIVAYFIYPFWMSPMRNKAPEAPTTTAS